MVIRLRPISIMVYNIKMKYVKATVIYLFSHFPRLIVLSVSACGGSLDFYESSGLRSVSSG